ncbi:MAG: pyridoxal-dependent decarboxylase [Caulobacteraceae bacterium]
MTPWIRRSAACSTSPKARSGGRRRPPSADRFAEPLPRGPRDLEDVLGDVDALIAPFVVGNTHPRFFGWAHGAGTPVGVVAELIAAALNANCGGRDHIGPVVERQITRWAAEAFGFPASSSGVFVTGASQANFLGLLVARDAALGHAVRKRGLKAEETQLCAYASVEAHGCVRQGDGACWDRLGVAAGDRDRPVRRGAPRRAAGRHRLRPRGGPDAVPDRRHRRRG